jgi:hypothetical protein
MEGDDGALLDSPAPAVASLLHPELLTLPRVLLENCWRANPVAVELGVAP